MFDRFLNTPLGVKTHLTGEQPETFTKLIILKRCISGPCFQLIALMDPEPFPSVPLRLLNSEKGYARRV